MDLPRQPHLRVAARPGREPLRRRLVQAERALGAALAAALLVAGHALPGADAPARPTPPTSLVGVWSGFVVNGKGETPDTGPIKLDLTITATEIHGVETKGETKVDHGTGTYELDLTTTPATLDATQQRGANRDVWRGILQLDGDTLRWCVHLKERPTTFETGNQSFLLILKRAPAAPP